MIVSRPSITSFILLFFVSAAFADAPAPQDAKRALQVFNDLIGSWRGTGTPEGTRAEKQRGFWQETLTWVWRFKGADVWIELAVAKGKYLSRGELRWLPESKHYQLTLTDSSNAKRVFTGVWKDKRLAFERVDAGTKETQRLLFSLLHDNRFLYRYEVKPAGKNLFARQYEVGAVKDGVPFAGGDGKPECIVSGGAGTIAVTYKNQTYFVCCSGCRDAFRDDPETYIQEARAKKAKGKTQVNP